MEGLIGGMILAFLGQAALIWHRLGKVEQKLDDVCRAVYKNGRQDREED